MDYFLDLLGSIKTTNGRRISILDVGGDPEFWDNVNFDFDSYELVLINIEPRDPRSENMTCVVGDACKLTNIEDDSFDVVFSNSVIEHVGDRENQKAMAKELHRVGGMLFLQTPNLWFPLETHFLMPWFQFYPIWLRTLLLTHFDLGGYRKTKNWTKAKEEVMQIRLLSGRHLRQLFPGAEVQRERIFGLTNGFIVSKGWPVGAKSYRDPRKDRKTN